MLLKPAEASSSQGTNGSRSKIKKEIPRLGFGGLIHLYSDPNPDNFCTAVPRLLSSLQSCFTSTICQVPKGHLLWPQVAEGNWRMAVSHLSERR